MSKPANQEENTYVFKVQMSCGGCETSVKEALKKQTGKGIKEFTVDLPTKLVTIIGTLTAEETLAILQKTGKEVELIKNSS